MAQTGFHHANLLVSEIRSDLHENQEKMLTNPWLSDIFMRVDDDSEDSDSEDWGSDNGDVVDTVRWNGDHSISPINPPITPSNETVDYDSDESDESDGILISCGSYVFDDEEDQRLAEERLHFMEQVNRKWNEDISTTDETDSSTKRKTKNKRVYIIFHSSCKLNFRSTRSYCAAQVKISVGEVKLLIG